MPPWKTYFAAAPRSPLCAELLAAQEEAEQKRAEREAQSSREKQELEASCTALTQQAAGLEAALRRAEGSRDGLKEELHALQRNLSGSETTRAEPLCGARGSLC